jgi:hypothetical protein
VFLYLIMSGMLLFQFLEVCYVMGLAHQLYRIRLDLEETNVHRPYTPTLPPTHLQGSFATATHIPDEQPSSSPYADLT